jgi:hypothetical protein
MNLLQQLIETGPTRIAVDSSYYIAGALGLLAIQTLLGAVKPSILSTKAKRILGTPLLVADLILPAMFSDGSGCMYFSFVLFRTRKKGWKMIISGKKKSSLNFSTHTHINSLESTWCDHSLYGLSPLCGSILARSGHTRCRSPYLGLITSERILEVYAYFSKRRGQRKICQK